MRFSLPFITAVTALPLVIGCTAASNQGDEGNTASPESALISGDKEPTFDPDMAVAPPPDELIVSTTETGDGWKKIRVVGKALNEASALVAVDRTLVVITDKSKVDNAPVATFAKTEIKAELAAKATASKTAYALAPDAVPEGEEADIIDPITADQVQSAQAAGTPITYFSCSNEEKTYSKTISTTKTYSHNKTTETGALTGSVNVQATLQASGTGKVVIKVHRSPWSACVPYKVSFRRATFTGNADVTAKTNVDAQFEKAWKYDKKVAQPSLGTLAFTIGPIPVKINFSAPIHVGVEAAAKAKMKANGTATAKATLNVQCTSGGCGGTKTSTFTFTPGASPVVELNGKVAITPYAYAGVHANLYTDWLANAEIGVKAKLKNDLWAYAGNTCGDGDFSGGSEFVTAAALDMRFGVDLIGKAALVGNDYGPWTYGLLDKHVAFYDLGGSGPSAMAPMLQTKANPLGSTTVQATGRMRPCWPWTDKMKYRVDYNNGSTTEFFETPSTMFSKVHNYGTFGSKVVSVTAIGDEQGRTPGKTTTDSIYLRPLIFDPIVIGTKVLSP